MSIEGEAVATVIKAIYEDGVFKPEGPVALADKSQVCLVVEPAPEADASASWRAWQEIIGSADDPDSPTDVAQNHDYYLYGAPKKL